MKMDYKNEEIRAAAEALAKKFDKAEDKRSVSRAPELVALYERLKTLPAGPARAEFGKEVNKLKQDLEQKICAAQAPDLKRQPIDVTAPFDINAAPPQLLSAEQGSIHPLMAEMDSIINIFGRMGFTAVESPELDDDYHMFTSLNFPPDHPARDEYDTFVTDEGFLAPAHTSTMQNRVLKAQKENLAQGQPIAAIIPGRVFRNEDLDARHEHTFYQLEGIFVGENINAGHLIATLKAFLEEYYGQELEVKTQPFYFPFTEPSFEFALSCPFCQNSSPSHLDAVQGSSEERTNRILNTENERQSVSDAAMRQKPAGATGTASGQGEAVRGGGKGCHICSYTGWIELLGCGMIHPNVLKEAGIDPAKYSGFAWGCGIDRLVMLKYDIEDVRHFESANLKFLRQF